MKFDVRQTYQPRKIRKELYNLPHHKRHKLMVAPLTKEARQKYGVKRMPIRVGDTVIIKKGRFKGIIGKVVKVIPKKLKIHVEGAMLRRAGGTMVHYPIYVYNVAIVDLDLSDPQRKKILERKRKIVKKEEILSESTEEGEEERSSEEESE